MKWLAITLGFLVIGGIAGYFIYKDLAGDKATVTVLDSQAVVEEVQLLGRLELVKYKIKDVFTQRSTEKVNRLGQSWLGQFEVSSEIILIVAGEAIGCIDLAKLTAQDIRIDADTVYVRVPEPEVCVFKIDHQNTQVMNTKFDNWDYRKDKAALKAAEKAVEQNALNQGILTETRNQAGPFLTALFQKFGFAKVVLESQAVETGPVAAPASR
ncbi:MAG: DUF4230 domain-containing protein [Bacteroidia bacterium]|nr:DUF4230 domain-containing protein [Bacteroidia bacterium]